MKRLLVLFLLIVDLLKGRTFNTNDEQAEEILQLLQPLVGQYMLPPFAHKS